ncbi:MAG: hypothetical protein ACK4S6_03765 [Roseateles asaccharophilus]|uniref:hypothetical protein n=1 Tax=Roseateles asaccharophilus TaxID=582607 RepID=UPI0039188B0F
MKHRLLLPLLLAALLAAPVQAHEGHDEAPAAATGQALPRFAASSELFELVGVLDGRQLTLYLDHAASNAPVQGATLELDFGGAKLKPVPKSEGEGQGQGEFTLQLEREPQPGLIPVTATVLAGRESDLLAGELDLHAHEPAAPAASARWKYIAAGALALLGLGAGLRLGRQRRAAA